MKKLFTLCSLLFFAVSGVWATDYVLSNATVTSDSHATYPTSGTTYYFITNEKVFSMAPSGGQNYAGGSNNTIKFTHNKQYTITIPAGVEDIKSMTIYGYSNYAVDAYVKEVDGIEYQPAKFMFPGKDGSTAQYVTYNIAISKSAGETLTFTPYGTQVCWLITLSTDVKPTSLRNEACDGTYVIKSANYTGSKGASSPDYKTWYFSGGWEVLHGGNAFAGGNNNTIKFTTPAQNTITPPAGVTVTGVSFFGYANDTKAANKTNYISELNGTSYTEGDGKIIVSGNDASTSEYSTASFTGLSITDPFTFSTAKGADGGNYQSCLQITMTCTPYATLNENATLAPVGGYPATAATVTLNRTLSSSYYNTICLPFAVDLTDTESPLYGADVQEFNSVDGTNLKFTAVSSTMVAGTPYLVKPTADLVNPTFTGVTITAATPTTVTKTSGDKEFKFKGAYYMTTLATDKTDQFFKTDGTFGYPSSAATANMKGLRAFFTVPAEIITGARGLSISFDNETTAITGVESSKAADAEVYYNLNGQRVMQPAKGLYIVNGKKTIIK